MNFPGFTMFKEGVRRMLRQDPDVTRHQVDLVAQSVSRAVLHAKDEIWVDAEGVPHKIGEMERDHLVHSLALIVRKARAGAMWRMSPRTGRMIFILPRAP